MSRRVTQERVNYQVVCTWCGATIRHNNVKESRGMCLKCYARMLTEHTRTYQLTNKHSKVSER
jgi:ribosomal protein L40E